MNTNTPDANSCARFANDPCSNDGDAPNERFYLTHDGVYGWLGWCMTCPAALSTPLSFEDAGIRLLHHLCAGGTAQW